MQAIVEMWKANSFSMVTIVIVVSYAATLALSYVVTMVRGYPPQPPVTPDTDTSDDDDDDAYDDDDDRLDSIAYLTSEQVKDLATQVTAELNKAIVERLEVVSVTSEWTDEMIDSLALRIFDRMVELDEDKASTPEPTTTAASSTAAIKPSDVAVTVRA